MLLRSLKLTNFRNYKSANVNFETRVNLFLGANGQGKTNLIEAISYLTLGRPIRYCRKEDLLLNGLTQNTLRVEGVVQRKENDYALSTTIHDGRIQHKVGDKITAASRLRELFSIVLFSPESLSVIKSGPQERRDLVDDIAVLLDPAVAASQKELQKCLKTKNRVLKDVSQNRMSQVQAEDLLGSLNEVLLPLATEVISSRLAALRTVLPLVNKSAKFILKDPSVDISVDYVISKKSSIDWGKNQVYDTLKLRLNELKDAEIRTGQSLVGPHKNDVVFKYNHQDARFFCSQGQQRAIVLAFKIAQVELCHLKKQHYPLLLLDDVLSELDKERREQLLEILSEVQAQIFLTSTDLGTTQMLSQKNMTVFRIEKGSVNF
jgi:DNA replication and repair protein RecF